MLIATVLRHMLTDPSNITYELARVIGFTYALAFLGLTVWGVAAGTYHWDPISWCASAGGLLMATGVSIAVKANTEPKPGQ